MKLDYSVKNSVLLSNESWKSYLDASYVDSESIIRPIQLYFEYVPDNFNGKVCILILLYNKCIFTHTYLIYVYICIYLHR